MLLVTTTVSFFFIKKIVPVRRKMLNVSPATNNLIIQPWRNAQESYQPSLKVEFSPSHCSHVISFSLSLVEERGQEFQNGNWSVNHGKLVDKHLLWWVYTFLRIKKNSRERKRTYMNYAYQNSHVWDIIKKT